MSEERPGPESDPSYIDLSESFRHSLEVFPHLPPEPTDTVVSMQAEPAPISDASAGGSAPTDFDG